MNFLIKNGRIVTPNKTIKGDLLVQGEKIVEIAQKIEFSEGQIIDAHDCFVFPGGIDVHTHFCLDVGVAVAQDDFYSGTIAAAMGGTTTIIDHPGFGPPGCSLHHQIEKYHTLAKGKAVIDYSFHGVLQHWDEEIATTIPQLMEAGITSAKVYMTYDYRFTEQMLRPLLKVAGECGMLIAIHAEDDARIGKLCKEFKSQGKTDVLYHPLSRPVRAEEAAIESVLRAAGTAQAPVYIVHLSTTEGLQHIKKAKKKGQKVFTETCPQYLLLDEERYLEPDLGGLKYVMSPPLRAKSHQADLWKGLAEENIDVAATDHCPFDFAVKKRLGAADFTRCPGGVGGVEVRLALLFSEGVQKKRLTVQQFARVIAENPARIMGLLPRKGRLTEGADADIVIIDPEKRVTVSNRILHQNVDYTPYEGMVLSGWPVLTMVRGAVVAKDGIFMGEKGFGRFIKRNKSGSNDIE